VPQVPPVSMEFTTAPDELLAHANRVLADNQRLDAEVQRMAGELSSLRSRVAAIRRHPILGIVNELRRRRARARR
jgi:DNA-binding transcriptional LysR family regulator